MDQELLIIELLSAAEPIYKRARKNRQKNLVSAFLFLIIASVLFFGIGSFVYQQLEMRVRSIDSGYWVRGFYHFSLVLGLLSVLAVVLLFIINAIPTIFGTTGEKSCEIPGRLSRSGGLLFSGRKAKARDSSIKNRMY